MLRQPISASTSATVPISSNRKYSNGSAQMLESSPAQVLAIKRRKVSVSETYDARDRKGGFSPQRLGVGFYDAGYQALTSVVYTICVQPLTVSSSSHAPDVCASIFLRSKRRIIRVSSSSCSVKVAATETIEEVVEYIVEIDERLARFVTPR